MDLSLGFPPEVPPDWPHNTPSETLHSATMLTGVLKPSIVRCRDCVPCGNRTKRPFYVPNSDQPFLGTETFQLPSIWLSIPYMIFRIWDGLPLPYLSPGTRPSCKVHA